MEQNRSAGGITPPISLELGRDDAFDVFQENSGRSCAADAVEDEGEEVSRVFVSGADSGCTKWLTWKTAADDRHSGELFPRESAEIRPDRSRIKLPAFHAREK
jgi:hypothetical protein